MLYLADRRQLMRVGKTITGDRPYSMPCGPVLSRVLNLLNGEIEGSYWGRHISTASKTTHFVDLVHVADTGLLTENEMESLRRAFNYLHDKSWPEIKALFHARCQEWENPHGSSTPITFEAMLKACGKGREFIEEAQSQQEEAEFILEHLA